MGEYSFQRHMELHFYIKFSELIRFYDCCYIQEFAEVSYTRINVAMNACKHMNVKCIS